MKSKLWLLTTSLLLSDIAMFLVAFLLAYYLRILSGIFPRSFVPVSMYVNIIVLSLVMLVIVFASLKLYSEKRTLFDVDEFMNVLYGLFFVFFILASITFLFKVSRYSRLIILFMFIFSLLLITFGRVALRIIQREFRKQGFNLRKTLIIGDKERVETIKEKIKASPELGYKIIGTITNGQKLDLKKLSAIIQKKGVAVVFLPSNFKKKQELYELIFNNPNTRFNIIPDIMEIVSEKISFEEFKDVPIMTIKEEAGFQLYSLIKTIADRMFAAFLIIILSLFLIIFAGLIKLTSKGPVFYCHTRLGKNLNHFKLYKFRTMVPKASSIKVRLMKRNHSKYLFKMKNDPRITPVGKCLRRFCLDELPQLINILKGEMSFVGPRPHLPSELREFKGWKKKRFTIKPGLTGLWQVSGRHDLNFDRSVSLDLYYIKNLSFILDIKILLKTIPAILFSKGKW